MAFLDQVSALADQYFKNGGMVAKFQDGGDVDPDDVDSMDSGYDMSPSVSETAASEDIGAISGDRGPDDSEDIDEDLGTFPEEAITGGPPPDDTGDGDDVTPDYALGDPSRDFDTAAEAIMSARGMPVDRAIQEAVKAQAAARAAVQAPQPERETVTEKALQVDEFGPLFDTAATRPTAPKDGIGAVLTEGYDMAGRPAPAPDIYDDDVDQGSVDVGALAKELGIDVKDVDFRERGLADLMKPGGVLKDIGGLFTGKGALKEAAAGGKVVKNEEGKTVGVVSYDEQGKVSKVTPVGISESFDPALRDAYRDFYANQPEERGSGDDLEPITEEQVAVEEEVAPKKPPTIDIVPFRPEDFYYFTPGSFAYNRGIPSMMNMRTQ